MEMERNEIKEANRKAMPGFLLLALVGAFFLISATYSGGFAMIEKHLNMYVLAIVTFLVILAEGVIIQQKVVDINKIMYPEKTASVYDLKFQKKWVDSCDEAGKIMRELAERFIGKDVYINLLDGRADGVIKEVTDNGIVLENKNGMQVVNLDYVVELREYPHNKKGKRSTIMDM